MRWNFNVFPKIIQEIFRKALITFSNTSQGVTIEKCYFITEIHITKVDKFFHVYTDLPRVQQHDENRNVLQQKKVNIKIIFMKQELNCFFRMTHKIIEKMKIETFKRSNFKPQIFAINLTMFMIRGKLY